MALRSALVVVVGRVWLALRSALVVVVGAAISAHGRWWCLGVEVGAAISAHMTTMRSAPMVDGCIVGAATSDRVGVRGRRFDQRSWS